MALIGALMLELVINIILLLINGIFRHYCHFWLIMRSTERFMGINDPNNYQESLKGLRVLSRLPGKVFF